MRWLAKWRLPASPTVWDSQTDLGPDYILSAIHAQPWQKTCSGQRASFLFANTPSPGSQTLRAATTDTLLLTKLRNLLVNNHIVYIAFTTCSLFSEDRNCVLRVACASRGSHRADEHEDYVKNLITTPAIVKTPNTAPLPRKASASHRPSLSCRARPTRGRWRCIQRALKVHQNAALVIRRQQYQAIKRFY